MANNLNTKRILTEVWPAALAATPSKMAQVGRMLTGPAGTVKFGSFALGGPAQTVADGATSVTAQDIASFQSSFTTAERVIKHTVPTHRLINEEGFLEGIQGLAIKVSNEVESDFFSGLEGLLTAASPRAGAGVGQCAVGKLYCDTAKKALQGEAGEFLYANKISSDLSFDSLAAAYALLRGLRDDRGTHLGLGQAGVTLVCNTADYAVAQQLATSMYSSAALQTNIFAGQMSVVDWGFTDTDAFFLIDKSAPPVGYHMSRTPSVEIRESEDGIFTHLVAKWHGCFVYSPYEYGLVASVGA